MSFFDYLCLRDGHQTNIQTVSGMATQAVQISIPAELFRWIAYLLPVYYMIAYKQLFGYGWWGTLWRYVVCCVLAFVQMIILSGIAYHFLSHTP